EPAAALAVTRRPLSRWTQPCACRFALYWLRAATRASPAASTTSVDDARTATLRRGNSTSSSTSPTASLPGPTEEARNWTTRASTPVACEIEWHTASMSPVPEPSACTRSSARESLTLARGPSCVPPEYVMASRCQPVDGSVMRCPLDVQRSEGAVRSSTAYCPRRPEPEPHRVRRANGPTKQISAADVRVQPSVGGVGLTGVAGVEDPHPRSQPGRHINHGLALRQQPLREPPTDTPRAPSTAQRRCAHCSRTYPSITRFLQPERLVCRVPRNHAGLRAFQRAPSASGRARTGVWP